jgi:hypothetical protein
VRICDRLAVAKAAVTCSLERVRPTMATEKPVECHHIEPGAKSKCMGGVKGGKVGRDRGCEQHLQPGNRRGWPELRVRAAMAGDLSVCGKIDEASSETKTMAKCSCGPPKRVNYISGAEAVTE